VIAAGRLVVLPREVERTNPQAISRLIGAAGINRVYMVPTFLERVADSVNRHQTHIGHISTVLFAGERLSSNGRQAVEVAFPRAQLHNLYGPIETNVITARTLTRGAAHDSSDVGPPLPGVLVKVRAPDGQLADHGRG
jgi:acyl-coenzyme A synthetase/AMP-(fatty) acid ligase